MRFDGLPISEDDLLAWLEGELPEQRRLEVERALAAAPEAQRALEGMAADRRALRSMSAETFAAPEGIVRRAIAAAERQAVLEVAPVEVVGRIRPMLRKRFAVAAGLVAMVGGAWIAVNGSALRPRTLRPPAAIEPGERFASLTDAPAELAADASALAEAAPATAAPASAPPETAALADARGVKPHAAEASADAALAAQPVSRDVIDSMLPLRDLLAAVEAAETDASRRFIMLESLEGQPRPVARAREVSPARVTPASTSDALMLASLNRLNLRVQTRDPATVDRALRSYSERVNRDVRLVSQVQPDGSVRYAVETDRDESEMNLLLAALRNACDECVQTTRVDASLAPAPCPMTSDCCTVGWTAVPGAAAQRVSLPIIVQTIRP